GSRAGRRCRVRKPFCRTRATAPRPARGPSYGSLWPFMLTTAAAGWAAKIGKAIGAGSARVLSAYYAADWLQAASARALPPGSAEVRAVTQMQRRWEVKLG